MTKDTIDYSEEFALFLPMHVIPATLAALNASRRTRATRPLTGDAKTIMDHQEMFDAAVAGVIRQGAPSTRPSGACCYRNEDGLKCALGWLIPDDKYTPEMERWTVGQIADVIGADDSVSTKLLISSLISAHDEAAYAAATLGDFVERFKKKAVALARRHGLNDAVARD